MNNVSDISSRLALEILREGNTRFVEGKRLHPYEFLTRAKETAEHGQRPVATILSCSDSRVPLEIIFDQSLGDIFSIRVIGNVCRDSQRASIEFGVNHLGTRLCVVLGHTKCGAVTAACTEAELEENIRTLMLSIAPAVERAQASTGKTGSEIVEICCVENVFVQMETILRKSSSLRECVRRGDLMIVGGVYDIESGHVTFLGPHPDNDELVKERERK